ncbi:hypothetical protein F5Y16DRAFT_400934 [Xylariaceae sp. FL0255]|nr:hypothetical protein F5Y16DRAFT_400934 [Xylariaceae sp. FL0255]
MSSSSAHRSDSITDVALTSSAITSIMPASSIPLNSSATEAVVTGSTTCPITDTTSKSSASFGELPTELRIMIWDLAVLAEAQERVIIIQGVNACSRPAYATVTKNLLSPFLVINSESRERALRVYTYPINVTCDLFGLRNAQAEFPIGTMYVSLEHNIFIATIHSFDSDAIVRAKIDFSDLKQKVENVCSLLGYVGHAARTGRIGTFKGERGAHQLFALVMQDHRLALFMPAPLIKAFVTQIQHLDWEGLVSFMQFHSRSASFAKFGVHVSAEDLDRARQQSRSSRCLIPPTSAYRLLTGDEFFTEAHTKDTSGSDPGNGISWLFGIHQSRTTV